MLAKFIATLEKEKQRLDGTTIHTMFQQDPSRFQKLSRVAAGICYDFSKQRLDTQALQVLIDCAKESGLAQGIADLFAGKHVNNTEDRPALHMRLRDPQPTADIAEVLEQMRTFVNAIQTGDKTGATGLKFTDVLSIGIGGSALGPQMAYNALIKYNKGLKLHFLDNIDPSSVALLLDKLNPATTLCIVNSKSFTTIETKYNADVVTAWLRRGVGTEYQRHLVAITANPEKAISNGFLKEQVFPFWQWVGGRFSLWSAIGLPLALSIGMDDFLAMLEGASNMDQHFVTCEFENNLPVLMALVGLWNINVEKLQTLAVIPYTDRLKDFPEYLQQLDMESNGKGVTKQGEPVMLQTAAVLWGGVGCNSQHAFMQALHQGTQVVPIDFILVANSDFDYINHRNLLLSSCIAQGLALTTGKAIKDKDNTGLAAAKRCPGNRPVSTILLEALTPRSLGSLCALYEHKTFVQGFLWGIQSFDQWGVELGKSLATNIVASFTDTDVEVDVATVDLIKYVKTLLVD